MSRRRKSQRKLKRNELPLVTFELVTMTKGNLGLPDDAPTLVDWAANPLVPMRCPFDFVGCSSFVWFEGGAVGAFLHGPDCPVSLSIAADLATGTGRVQRPPECEVLASGEPVEAVVLD